LHSLAAAVSIALLPDGYAVLDPSRLVLFQHTLLRPLRPLHSAYLSLFAPESPPTLCFLSFAPTSRSPPVSSTGGFAVCGAALCPVGSLPVRERI
jgi:hypothetical protein